MGEIAGRLAEVQRRMGEAARRAGRSPEDVGLVAVSKTQPADRVREAIAAGATALGENYVQELVRKREQIGEGVEWHFIGHLQTNKVKYLAPFCALIHGVDSLRVAAEISKRAGALGRTQPVLIEVNLSGEAAKSGLAREEALDLARGIVGLPSIELRGLMTMPPYPEDPEQSRPYFVSLRALQEQLRRGGIPATACAELSMGMTADYEIAIEEGATLVRVGTAIFGARDNTASQHA
jgi:pyridoxal phosphate enzyme (YggS family)